MSGVTSSVGSPSQPSPQPLLGRVALITGASSGIGEATARALSAAGASVVLGARRYDRIAVLAEELGAKQDRALAVKTDVANEAEAQNLVAAAVSAFGGLDIVVNNAGVMAIGPVAEAQTEDWRRMIDANILGTLYCTHGAMPHLIERGGGDIVNVSSAGGRRTSAGRGVYSLTKFGVGAFSEALRQEALEHDIRVTLIEPGFVETEISSTGGEFMAAAAREGKARIGQVLKSSDVANAIIYAVTQPSYVSINEILMRPTRQLS